MRNNTEQDARRTAWWNQFLTQNQSVLDEAFLQHDGVCTLDWKLIQSQVPGLSEDLLEYPKACLRIADNTARETMTTPSGEVPRYTYRVKNLPSTHVINPKEVRSDNINKFIGLQCVVKKATEVYPRLLEGCFECEVCANQEHIEQVDPEFQQTPKLCGGCGKPGPWQLIEDESSYVDEQKWLLSDDPSFVEPGAQPQELHCIVRGDQVESAKGGENVIVNGIVVPVPKREGVRKKQENRILLMQNSVEHLQETHGSLKWSKVEEEEFKAFAAEKDVLKEFRGNLATNIHGMEDVKESIILSIVGGVEQMDRDGNRERGDIHILLAGNPGSGKSQIMEAIPKFTPRSIYASGEGASSAGLTAAAVKSDFGDGGWALEVGAMGLASGGTFILDEMDKMKKDAMGSMHRAMEQQSVDVHKAGIHAHVNTQCNVIAACNPKFGVFDDLADDDLSQINLPAPMFSRFDLIFIIKGDDTRQGIQDVAEHIFGLSKVDVESIDKDWLRKYIAYSKTINPVVEEEVARVLMDYFVDFKSDPSAKEVNYRALHSLRRLAQAHARLNLRETASLDDANAAIRLYMNWAKAVGYDANTGKFDMGVVNGAGAKYSQHERNRTVLEIITTKANTSGLGFVNEDEVFVAASMRGIDREAVEKALDNLKRDSTIYSKGGGGTWAPL